VYQLKINQYICIVQLIKTKIMTQKETVFQFVSNLDNSVSKKEAAEMFVQSYPSIPKSVFMWNVKFAITEGLWNPKEDQIVIGGLPMSVQKAENVMEFVEETVDITKIDPNTFKALQTGTAFDKIASKRNGIMPGTAYIVTGESGAGKTTICTNIADYLKEVNPDITTGFISCEMDKKDWEEEVSDNPRLGSLKTVFMLNYLEASNYVEILETGLRKYDFVILDSFEVVIDQLKEVKGWTSKKAESELINILRKAAAETNCTIFAIQQYTKGGTFVGSNKIKHMLTGMMFVMFDNDGDRYITFTKNRRGGHMVGKKLYFNKNKQTGRLEFNDEKFENAERISEFSETNKTNIEKEALEFDTLIMQAARDKAQIKVNVLNGVTNDEDAEITVVS